MPRLARFAALFALLAAPAWAQGRLEFDATEHAFGTVEEGAKAKHVFRFTNTGDQPVTLAQVRASCGCTTPSYTQTPVAPGERGEIEVVYNSQNRPGPFNKSVAVTAEGAVPAGYTLKIEGDVRAARIADGFPQGNLYFEADHYEQWMGARALEQRFTFQSKSRRPVKFLTAASMPEGAEIALPEKPVYPGEVAHVTVTLPAAMLVGDDVDVTVAIETDDTAKPIKTLRLVGRRPYSTGSDASPAGQ